MKNLIPLNEFFETGAFGDTYGDGGGTGIFKITYRPFKDMSAEAGVDKDVIRDIDGSEFKIGDIVIGIPVNEKKEKVAGIVVKSIRNENNIYRIFVQVNSRFKKRGQRVMELKLFSIEHADLGNKGHNKIISNFKINTSLKGEDSKKVFTSSDLGIETIGG